MSRRTDVGLIKGYTNMSEFTKNEASVCAKKETLQYKYDYEVYLTC